MQERTITASEFKARCFALLDQVRQTKVPLVITKRGEPVARLVPIAEDDRSPTMGSVTLIADDDAAYYRTRDDWDADDRLTSRR